jgi:hypothetical protein
MKTVSKSKSALYTFAVLLFTIPLLISCGGGGGGASVGGGGGGVGVGGGGNPITLTTVDSFGDVGLYTSMTTGSVHISYFDDTNNNLKYAYCDDNGSCSTPIIIDSVGDVSLDTKVSVIKKDSSDALHIGYYDSGSGFLKYATCSSICTNAANWATSTVDNTADVGSDISMAIDSSGNMHISYYDNDNIDLKYATNKSVTAGNGNCFVGADFDCVIADNGDVGEYTSIALDSADNVHISYYDNALVMDGDLKYATNAGISAGNGHCFAGSDFDCVTVDSTHDVGIHTSLAIDSSGNLHISHYDFINGNLNYATCSSACTLADNWDNTSIDSTGDVGEYTSLAIDSSDKLHVSYRDDDNSQLKYATNISGSWVMTNIDNSADVGYYTSIDINSSDSSINISYYDIDNGNLKYAKYSP